MNEIAIRAENISKCYRIGMKEKIHDSLGSAIIDFIQRPIKNYKKYRSLYKFDDIHNGNSEDIIWALQDVSFEVNRGEVVGIIGVNGAGKSTLLKILSRITTPTTGVATIYGRLSSLLEVGTGFHPELTGRENIYLNGTILGMRKKEIDRKFDEIVEFSGVERFIDTPVKRYSSGMKVRLAFSVAAHLEPEILLIDEVLAVGDHQFQKKCLNKMQDIGQEGRTVLFVSHNMPAVTRLCPRTILLSDGKVIADGPSPEVVSIYMNSEKATRAERVWDDITEAPGDDIVRLLAVRVRNEEGIISEVIDITKPIAVEMEYEVLKPDNELLVYYHLFNDHGIRIFESIENDPAFANNKPRPVGRYVSTSWIPGNMLSEGMFFISPAIRTLNPEIRRLRVNDAVAFQVIDKMDGNSARMHYRGNLGGIIRPYLKWKTKYIPEGNNSSRKTAIM